jgi:hypothetical protein
MVLEVETLTKEDCDRGYTIKGDLNGDYQDVTNYLTWALNTSRINNAEHLKLAIETITKRFMPYVTTKYLKTFIEGNNSYRKYIIRELLRKAGYTTEPVKQYKNGLRCIISQTNNLIFGQGVLLGTKVCRVSRVSRVFIGEVLHKVITQKEVDARQQIFREEYNAELLRKELIENSKGNPYSPIGHIMDFETTTRQEKAIRKFQQKEEIWINLNCPECKHQIKLPVSNNIKDEKVVDIMNWIGKDIKAGNYLCGSCKVKREKMLNENNRFDYSAILNQLEQMKNSIIGNQRCFSIPTLSFMMEFYMDLGLPSIDRVEKILTKAKDSIDFDYLIKLDSIKIKFN